MQYILMLYVNEAGWSKLTKAQQEQGVAAALRALRRAYSLRMTSAAAAARRVQP